jgi:hypothetical protein
MRRFTLAAMLACVLWTGHAAASEQLDLERGRNAYLARQYTEADARFAQMLDPKGGSIKDPALLSQARMYWGAVKIALKRRDDAVRIFEELLTQDPQFEPDPLSFPTEVLDELSAVRFRIRERLAAQAREAARRDAERKAREEADRRRETERVARLEQLAGEETVRERRNRLVAFIPFGAGQFQNGDKTLGWIFFGVEAGALALGTILIPFQVAEREAAVDANRPATDPDATRVAEAHRTNAERLRIINLSAYGLALVTGVVGIVQANMAFKPEVVSTQKRELPGVPPPRTNGHPTENGTKTSGLRLLPSLGPVPSGFGASLQGSF